MIEVIDAAAARLALSAGTLACPSCLDGRLGPWGAARRRVLLDVGGRRRELRPDRGRCRTCRATHVLLPAATLPGRAWTTAVIGAALSNAARGDGRRQIAAALGVPASTVGDWIRRVADNAETIRIDAMQKIVALDQDLIPDVAHRRPLADALEALGRLAMAIVVRFSLRTTPPWHILAVATNGRLLRPAHPG